MDKKGVELTLNTVIVGVLVVLALIVIVTFFLGGTAGLTSTIKDIFAGTTAGTTETIAVQTCNNRCEQAKTLPEGLRATSAYCTKPFNIDTTGDGKADTKKYCHKELQVPCEGIVCEEPPEDDKAPENKEG